MRKYLPPARGFDHSLTVYYGQADHYDHSIIGVERIRALREGMPPAARPVDLHRDSVRCPCPLAAARTVGSLEHPGARCAVVNACILTTVAWLCGCVRWLTATSMSLTRMAHILAMSSSARRW